VIGRAATTPLGAVLSPNLRSNWVSEQNRSGDGLFQR
jgi:hypothetical protein